MEELDIASERSELERDFLVRQIQARKGSGLLPAGECHWCGEEVAGQRLFCDSDCSTDWERHRRQ